jgi:spore coat protein U-like protein
MKMFRSIDGRVSRSGTRHHAAQIQLHDPPHGRSRWGTGLLASLHSASVIHLLALAIGLPSLSALAATAPSTMGVSSTVQATCRNTATALAFGVYTGTQVDATAIVTVTCTNTTPYTVSLNAGTAPEASVTTRRMTGGAGVYLAYALYSNAERTTNWGSTIGSDVVSGTGTGSGQAITVYGREAAGQFVTPGAYTDTITATVTY